jgi:3-hydroxyacyl-CoA dehydrogenase/enoyl-CoA hydratase/3-hydroxybutyryl-CoA epimerase
MSDEKGSLELRVDAEEIGHLIFDRPGDAPNVLGTEVMERLETLLADLEKRDLTGLVVRSAKPESFLAGADVEEIARLSGAREAEEKSAYGQAIFNRLEGLPFPVAAAVRGTCLGGGTELVLACHHAVLGDDPGTEIGLPEVRLGLIPGWGGTQRLPRRLPLAAAVDLILTGRSLRGRGAAELGLVHAVVPSDYVVREAVAWIRRVAGRLNRGPYPHAGRGFAGRAARLLPPFRSAFFSLVRRRTERRVRRDQYPAPFLALEAVEYGLGHRFAEGLAREAQLLAEAAMTEPRRNLTRLFFYQRDARKGHGAFQPDLRPRPVTRVGLLGAGVMGGGIAHLAAAAGLTVRMKDLDLAPLSLGLRAARETFEKQARRRRRPAREVEEAMARILPTTGYSGFGSLPVVIEAVVEKLEVKRKVLREVEEVTRGGCLFASNTSSIPIDRIAADCGYPENVLGMHFFNPVDRMPLVEVIRGTATSDEAVALVVDLCRRLKKTPVVVRDGPGFLVNRLLMAYLNEALFLLKEGMPIEVADQAMREFGMPMGPFELLDHVGIDVAQKVAGILGEAFGDRVRPPRILDGVAADGRLGRKNGRGFYRWKNDRRGGPDPTVYAFVNDRGGRIAPQGEAVDRMVLPMVNEAALCLLEGIARTPSDVDLAMVMGTGFPPFRGGLLRHADSLTLVEVVQRMDNLASIHGPRFRPVPLLRDLARSGRTFLPA